MTLFLLASELQGEKRNKRAKKPNSVYRFYLDPD